MGETMINRIPSDQEIELLKRALSRQCESLCIVPEGVEALFVAQQLMELFSLGLTDEQDLATITLSVADWSVHHQSLWHGRTIRV